MIVKDRLKEHFEVEEWHGHTSFQHYTRTGENLIDEINALDPDLVVDVGCGHNRFKGHIQNLIGFDQSPFPNVDIISYIKDINFRPESVDVALCLGSVQFGDRDNVIKELGHVVDWIKPGGYIVMRTMNQWFKRRAYPNEDYQYIWSEDDVKEIGNMYNLKLHKGIWEEFVPTGPEGIKRGIKYKSSRLSWWWQKPGTLTRTQIDPVTCEVTER